MKVLRALLRAAQGSLRVQAASCGKRSFFQFPPRKLSRAAINKRRRFTIENLAKLLSADSISSCFVLCDLAKCTWCDRSRTGCPLVPIRFCNRFSVNMNFRFVLLVASLTSANVLWSQPTPTVTIFAGTGSPTDNQQAYPPGKPTGKAASIRLGNPFGVEVVDRSIWITTVDDSCIWQCDQSGNVLRRIAGSGIEGYSGDGSAAVAGKMKWPHEVRVDQDKNLYVADTRNHVIRSIDASTGLIKTIAGSGKPGFAGDGMTGARVSVRSTAQHCSRWRGCFVGRRHQEPSCPKHRPEHREG